VDGLIEFEDFFWSATNIAIWSTIEPGVGIIAGCLATLRPLVTGIMSKARSVRSEKNSSHGASGVSYSGQRSKIGSAHTRSVRPGTIRSTAPQDEPIELTPSALGRKSTEDILLTTSEAYHEWQSTQSRSLDLDRRSTRSSHQRRASDSFDHPLPPLPLEVKKNNTSMV
jgi:hypothetical protein